MTSGILNYFLTTDPLGDEDLDGLQRGNSELEIGRSLVGVTLSLEVT